MMNALTETDAYEYLLYSIERRWGRDMMLVQTDLIKLLIENLESRGTQFDRDWRIDFDKVTEEVFFDTVSVPFLSPFLLFCMIDPNDIAGRKITTSFISPELEDFFRQLSTDWVLKVYETHGNNVFTCKVIEEIYDLWCYYRRVDLAYEREQLAGRTTSIRDLRRDCFKIETVPNDDTLTTEIKWDFGPSGGSTALKFTEGAGKRNATLEVTMKDKTLFDAFTIRELDTISCQLIRLLKKEGRQAAFYANGSEHKLILKCGAEEKQFEIDLKSRYEATGNNIAFNLTSNYGASKEDQDEMKQIGDHALFKAAISGTRGENISQHLYWSIKRALQHEFESISTESGSAARVEAGESKRILKSRIERSGGELNDIKVGSEGSEVSTLEWMEGENARKGYNLYGQNIGGTPEDRFAARQILEKVIRDDKDRHIMEQLVDGASQKEIARELGISAPAVFKRIKKIHDRAEHMMAEQQ